VAGAAGFAVAALVEAEKQMMLVVAIPDCRQRPQRRAGSFSALSGADPAATASSPSRHTGHSHPPTVPAVETHELALLPACRLWREVGVVGRLADADTRPVSTTSRRRSPVATAGARSSTASSVPRPRPGRVTGVSQASGARAEVQQGRQCHAADAQHAGAGRHHDAPPARGSRCRRPAGRARAARRRRSVLRSAAAVPPPRRRRGSSV